MNLSSVRNEYVYESGGGHDFCRFYFPSGAWILAMFKRTRVIFSFGLRACGFPEGSSCLFTVGEVITMSIGLKEAIYCSEKGYIDRAEDIREIMEHLSVLTLKELNDHCKYECLECFDVCLDMQHIPTSYVDKLSYIEMLCMMDSIKFEYWKDKRGAMYGIADLEYDPEKTSRLFYVYTMAETLVRASRSCAWVKLFFSVSVKAYMECIAAQSGKPDGFLEFKALGMLANDIDIDLTDSLTIGSFIKKAQSAMRKAWNPMQDIEEYAKWIYKAHRVVDWLLLYGIEPAYPKQFSLEQIRHNAAAFEKTKQKRSDVERSM